MIMDILDKLKASMFRPINTAAISIMGVFTVLWAFWVGNPFWEVFDNAPVYHFMTVFAPEWMWGVAALVVGILMLLGVAKNKYATLRTGALAGFYYWLFASFNFFMGDWQNTGGITLLMIAVYCGFIALNLYINKYRFGVDQDNLVLEKEE